MDFIYGLFFSVLNLLNPFHDFYENATQIYINLLFICIHTLLALIRSSVTNYQVNREQRKLFHGLRNRKQTLAIT